MSISMKGFPYADCFLVEVCHVATAQSGEDRDNNNILNVEIGLNVKFIKSSMMEWKIRSSTTAETTKSQTHLFQTVKDACYLFQSLKNMRLEAKERRKAEATATGEALAENNIPEEIIAQITEPKSEGKENNNIVTSGVPVEEEEILSNITEKDNLSSLAEEIIVSCDDSIPDVTATPDDKKEEETEIIVDKIYTEAEEDKIPMDVATASSPGEEAVREETNVQIESEEKVAGVDIETMEKPAARKDTLITATEKVNPSSLAKEISLSGEESIPIIITAPKESTAEIKDINSIANKMYAKKEAKLSNLTKKKNLFASVEMKKEMTAQHTAQNISESTEPFQAKEDCHCTWCPKSLYNFFRGSKPKPLFINPLPQERQSALQQLQDDSIRNMRGSVDSLREELLNIMEQGGLSSTKKDLILREVWVIKKSLDRISSISINNLEEESAEACQA